MIVSFNDKWVTCLANCGRINHWQEWLIAHNCVSSSPLFVIRCFVGSGFSGQQQRWTISGIFCDVRLATIVINLAVRLGMYLGQSFFFTRLLSHADLYKFIIKYQFTEFRLVLRYWLGDWSLSLVELFLSTISSRQDSAASSLLSVNLKLYIFGTLDKGFSFR